MAGHWIPVSYNPGLHVRNRYGYAIYKHSQHWLETGKWTFMHLEFFSGIFNIVYINFIFLNLDILLNLTILGKSDGWQQYSPGLDFSTCIRPGHHACLDQYRPDGNIQFRFVGP